MQNNNDSNNDSNKDSEEFCNDLSTKNVSIKEKVEESVIDNDKDQIHEFIDD